MVHRSHPGSGGGLICPHSISSELGSSHSNLTTIPMFFFLLIYGRHGTTTMVTRYIVRSRRGKRLISHFKWTLKPKGPSAPHFGGGREGIGSFCGRVGCLLDNTWIGRRIADLLQVSLKCGCQVCVGVPDGPSLVLNLPRLSVTGMYRFYFFRCLSDLFFRALQMSIQEMYRMILSKINLIYHLLDGNSNVYAFFCSSRGSIQNTNDRIPVGSKGEWQCELGLGSAVNFVSDFLLKSCSKFLGEFRRHCGFYFRYSVAFSFFTFEIWKSRRIDEIILWCNEY